MASEECAQSAQTLTLHDEYGDGEGLSPMVMMMTGVEALRLMLEFGFDRRALCVTSQPHRDSAPHR
ncbi:MAG: hypothetical protein QNK99_03635 [Burkholderiales bacterium]